MLLKEHQLKIFNIYVQIWDWKTNVLNVDLPVFLF